MKVSSRFSPPIPAPSASRTINPSTSSPAALPPVLAPSSASDAPRPSPPGSNTIGTGKTAASSFGAKNNSGHRTGGPNPVQNVSVKNPVSRNGVPALAQTNQN